MNFLLDTNVVSEWVKPSPNPGLLSWVAQVDEDRTFLSAITIMELRHGIQRLSAGRRQHHLDQWLTHDLLLRFEGRVISIDIAVADACGRVVARRATAGRPIELADAVLAATAEVYQLTLVSRDNSAFASVLPSVLNPWT